MKTIHQMRPSHCGFEGSGSDCPKSIPFKGELPVTPSQSRDNPQDPLRTKCLTTKPRVSSTLASNSDPFDSHLSPVAIQNTHCLFEFYLFRAPISTAIVSSWLVIGVLDSVRIAPTLSAHLSSSSSLSTSSATLFYPRVRRRENIEMITLIWPWATTMSRWWSQV